MNRNRFLQEWIPNEPLAQEDLNQLKSDSRMPDDYSKFIEGCNGGEGIVGPNYLILWRYEEAVELNKEYEVEVYAPGLFLIGSSGGGEAFGYDLRDSTGSVVMVPFIGLGWKDAIVVAKDLEGLFDALGQDTIYDG
ncbi:SMI1/KNR4 family protein [Luteibacter aegosomatis]|uniref:SMI1/KNR4 family protein n=1 Tax=Luteibacter aegosomatis TaxID=2911537 RepID=UPI001FFBD4DB|nr:SMI1/KNR4 family protein [Luteibacter aegosomatis]UPG87752.1 SMI1/KNR4 family protein [Luteibacter aegosomatis]